MTFTYLPNELKTIIISNLNPLTIIHIYHVNTECRTLFLKSGYSRLNELLYLLAEYERQKRNPTTFKCLTWIFDSNPMFCDYWLSKHGLDEFHANVKLVKWILKTIKNPQCTNLENDVDMKSLKTIHREVGITYLHLDIASIIENLCDKNDYNNFCWILNNIILSPDGHPPMLQELKNSIFCYICKHNRLKYLKKWVIYDVHACLTGIRHAVISGHHKLLLFILKNMHYNYAYCFHQYILKLITTNTKYSKLCAEALNNHHDYIDLNNVILFKNEIGSKTDQHLFMMWVLEHYPNSKMSWYVLIDVFNHKDKKMTTRIKNKFDVSRTSLSLLRQQTQGKLSILRELILWYCVNAFKFDYKISQITI